jgi:hypothetical protein
MLSFPDDPSPDLSFIPVVYAGNDPNYVLERLIRLVGRRAAIVELAGALAAGRLASDQSISDEIFETLDARLRAIQEWARDDYAAPTK